MWQCFASTWWRWPIVVGLLSLYLAACGPITRGPGAAPTPESVRQSQGPLARIGAALSLTGPAASAGIAQRNGLMLAEDEINSGHLLGSARLDLMVEDVPDRSRASEAFQKFVTTNHLVAIVGPTVSDDALAVDPIAQQAAVPVVAISNSASGLTEIGPFVFRECLAENRVTSAAVKAVKRQLGVRRAALLYADTDANRSGSRGFKKALQEMGVHIVTEQTFTSGDTDFSSQLTEIAASDPEALFVSAGGREAAPILLQARQLGLTRLPIVGSSVFASAGVIRRAGAAAEGLIVGANWSAANASPRNQQFIQNYREHFGAEPDQFAAQAYTGLYVIAEGIKNAGTLRDLRAIRDGLAHIQDLETPVGRFSFTEAREPTYPVSVEIVRNGQLQPFSSK
jgi:branched-chain amino acid transport system substrate-binding protein